MVKQTTGSASHANGRLHRGQRGEPSMALVVSVFPIWLDLVFMNGVRYLTVPTG